MKPSEIKVVTAKKAWFLLPGFRALTWKGVVYCKNTSDISLINRTDKVDSTLKCHETIHVRQAESTGDSWLRFYARYMYEWLRNLPLIVVNPNAPYRFIPFEIEAYECQSDLSYPDKGMSCKWKEYAALSLKERFSLARKKYWK